MKMGLLDRVCRDDLDAIDVHTLVGHIASAGGGGPDFLQHLVAFDQRSEGRVLAIEETGRREGDEELAIAPSRSRPACGTCR